jgi:putative ABC transport system permease protein
MEDDSRMITLRLLSFQPDETQPLNAFLVGEGALPDAQGILVGEAFAQAHGLSPGDALDLVLGGKKVTLTISGTVKSPDYVYVIANATQMMPDTAAFGVAYVPYRTLGALTGRQGEVNDLSFLLEDGYSLMM